VLGEKPVKGKVLLRTIFLMLPRLKPELPGFVMADETDELEAAERDAAGLDRFGGFAFDGSW
jgi:hypothetical protein